MSKPLSQMLEEIEPDHKSTQVCAGYVHVRVVDRASYERMKRVAIILAEVCEYSARQEQILSEDYPNYVNLSAQAISLAKDTLESK